LLALVLPFGLQLQVKTGKLQELNAGTKWTNMVSMQPHHLETKMLCLLQNHLRLEQFEPSSHMTTNSL